MFSPHPKWLLVYEEGSMQSTELEEIKAALWLQAFHGCTQVKCPLGQVMAIRRRKGHFLALLRGRGRWYPVEAVTIERPLLCPTGARVFNPPKPLPMLPSNRHTRPEL